MFLNVQRVLNVANVRDVVDAGVNARLRAVRVAALRVLAYVVSTGGRVARRYCAG